MIFKGLSRKLILYFLLVGLVPLLGMGLVAFSQSSRAMREEIGRELTGNAHKGMEKIEDVLHAAEGDVALLAQNPVIIGGLKYAAYDKAAALLKQVDEAYGRYYAIALIDGGGTVMAASDDSLVGISQGSADYYRRGIQGEDLRSSVIEDELAEKAMAMTAAIAL